MIRIKYVGCYLDKEVRDFEDYIPLTGSQITNLGCSQKCYQKNSYNFAATQKGWIFQKFLLPKTKVCTQTFVIFQT